MIQLVDKPVPPPQEGLRFGENPIAVDIGLELDRNAISQVSMQLLSEIMQELAGFLKDGREYVVSLGKITVKPANLSVNSPPTILLCNVYVALLKRQAAQVGEVVDDNAMPEQVRHYKARDDKPVTWPEPNSTTVFQRLNRGWIRIS